MGEDDASEQMLRSAAELADQRRLMGLSETILIRATVLHLLTAFVEFAVKQVFKLVLPDKELPKRPSFMKDLIAPLAQAEAITDFPPEYCGQVHKYRDVVRNQFAHGDWFELAREVQDLDIEKPF